MTPLQINRRLLWVLYQINISAYYLLVGPQRLLTEDEKKLWQFNWLSTVSLQTQGVSCVDNNIIVDKKMLILI